MYVSMTGGLASYHGGWRLTLRPLAPAVPRARRCISERPFRPIGHDNGKKESSIFGDWRNCYLASNDPYGETLHSILSLFRAGVILVDRFVSVVGSFVALQFLLAIRPRAIHFFDMNPCQIQWAQLLCELISISRSPQEFISRIFARNVAAFEKSCRGRRLNYLNQSNFLQLQVSKQWRYDTVALLSPLSRETYVDILQPFQEGERPGWCTATLLPCEDRRRFRGAARSGLGPQGRLPSDGFASFLYGEGWLTSQWTFNTVRHKLKSVPITWTTGIDFPMAWPADIIVPTDVPPGDGSSGERTLVFAMDMWSSHFARPWPRDRTLEWRGRSGRLTLIQSLTAQKHELVQELVGHSAPGPEALRWRSHSEWDSAALLPPHICQVGDAICQGCRAQGPEGELARRAHPLLSEATQGRRLLGELTAANHIPLTGR